MPEQIKQSEETIKSIITYTVVANIETKRHLDRPLDQVKANLINNMAEIIFKALDGIKGLKASFVVMPIDIKTTDYREKLIVPDSIITKDFKK